MLGEHSERDPPDPISNSEVKPFSANDSVGSSHAKVGHRQAPYLNPQTAPLPYRGASFKQLAAN